MPKKDLKGLLNQKSPGELRKGIQQIDILQEAATSLTPVSPEKEKREEEQTVLSDQKVSREKPREAPDKKERPIKTKLESDRVNRTPKRKKPRVFSEKDVQAVLAIEKRQTERYSFEIFSDQKEDIQLICDLYEEATGKKLSASRLIREVLDTFLPDAIKTFQLREKNVPEE